MALQKAMVSSKSNEWATPIELFNYLDCIFGFTLDPCATKENCKCKKFYTKEDDGLSKDWSNEVVFVNPPYGGQTGEWIEKCIYESHNNNTTVVMLIVSSTDRSYWHEHIDKHSDEIWFLRGRIKFGGVKSTAPFASAIVVFRPNSKKRTIKFIDIREHHHKR